MIPPRLIPAHAGKTLRISRPFKVRGAHPRSRGENFWCCSRFRPGEGSSPLTRGKRLRELRVSFDAGLIPAHAGKTPVVGQMRSWAAAHPRSRGENLLLASPQLIPWGSSPLTRGKRPRGAGDRGERRLIPAHAGKTAGLRRADQGHGAHPRSRGENDKCLNGIQSGSGSSPLTRGKRLRA